MLHFHSLIFWPQAPLSLEISPRKLEYPSPPFTTSLLANDKSPTSTPLGSPIQIIVAPKKEALLLFRSRSTEFSDDSSSAMDSNDDHSLPSTRSQSNWSSLGPSISNPSSPVNTNFPGPLSPNANGKRPLADDFFLDPSEVVSTTFVLRFICLFSTQVGDDAHDPSTQEAKGLSDPAAFQLAHLFNSEKSAESKLDSPTHPIVETTSAGSSTDSLPSISSTDALANNVDPTAGAERPSEELDEGHALNFRLSPEVMLIC